MEEEWRIAKRSLRFEVSNLGRVRTIKTGRIRKFMDDRGYCYVTLREKDSKRHHFVHRLVAEAFLEDFNPLMDVDHINRVRNDNRVSNLRMLTRRQNLANRNYFSEKKIERTIALHSLGLDTVSIMNALILEGL